VQRVQAGLGLGLGLGVQGQGQGQAELGLGASGVLGWLPDHSLLTLQFPLLLHNRPLDILLLVLLLLLLLLLRRVYNGGLMVKVNEYWKYLTRMCVYNARLNVRLRKFNRVK